MASADSAEIAAYVQSCFGLVHRIMLLGAPTGVAVTGHAFGLGLQLGAPSGITGKYYLGGRRNAIDFVLGGFLDTNRGFNNSIYLQGSYLWHPSTLAQDPATAL